MKLLQLFRYLSLQSADKLFFCNAWFYVENAGRFIIKNFKEIF